MKLALFFYFSFEVLTVATCETLKLIFLLGGRLNGKGQRKAGFFDLKCENQNTHVTYERDQRLSGLKPQAPVVQKMDNAIHRINHYPADNAIGFCNTSPLDSDLSGG